ncbi:MAG: response regulator [Phycisphaerales bacterium]|nr:response regulator [Phycisphaerales bacterium]
MAGSGADLVPGSAAAPRSTVRILMVEDETLFAKAVGKRLERSGYSCRHVTTLAGARTECREAMPDLLLLDMRLPDGSGLDFLAELRKERGVETPVIVLTAYGELEDAVAAMKLAASDYLKKPIDLDELLLNVEKVLAGASVSRQLQYSRVRERSAVEGVDLLGEHTGIREVREQAHRIGTLLVRPDVNSTHGADPG